MNIIHLGILAHIDAGKSSVTQNMLFAGILEPLQQIIEESGYVATVYYIDEEANEVAQARRICTERKPHGILFLGSNPEYFTPELEALGIPLSLIHI